MLVAPAIDLYYEMNKRVINLLKVFSSKLMLP
jgi:hypothetical protein